MRSAYLIAKSVLIEAVRRREIYAIVLISVLIIGAVMTVNFFNIQGLTKFYREIALQVMSVATSLTVIVLAARQLPREFENRTIYPLLSKPISRATFLLGKLLGVMAAGLFCFAIFMTIYVLGALYLKTTVPVLLFVQYVYLQMLQLLILATLSFWLSMLFNLDAAVTISTLLYFASGVLSSATSYLYDFVGRAQQLILTLLTFIVPQFVIFDLSGKAVHSSVWPPLEGDIIAKLTAYAFAFAALYFGLAMFCFRKRAL